jgi:glutamyl-tRNA reductase
MTVEKRPDRIEGILQETAALTKESAVEIKALVDAHMRSWSRWTAFSKASRTSNRGHQKLQAAQQKTEEMLQTFIRSLQKGVNGYS